MVEAARRAMTIGEDAVPSYRPSDFEAKKIIKQNSSWLEADANQQLQTTTNHINRERWGKFGKDARPSGNAGGALFDHYGGIRIGRIELGECKVN